MRSNQNALTRFVKKALAAVTRRTASPAYGTVFYDGATSCERTDETQEEYWQRIITEQPEVARQYQELRERGVKTIFFQPNIRDDDDSLMQEGDEKDERA